MTGFTRPLTVFYIVVLIATVVGVDVLFFRDRFWARLDGEHRDRAGVRGVLSAIREAAVTRASQGASGASRTAGVSDRT
jgi:hypothetical protein